MSASVLGCIQDEKSKVLGYLALFLFRRSSINRNLDFCQESLSVSSNKKLFFVGEVDNFEILIIIPSSPESVPLLMCSELSVTIQSYFYKWVNQIMVSVVLADGRCRTFTDAWIETYWGKRIKEKDVLPS